MRVFYTSAFLMVLFYPLLIIGAIFLLLITLDSARHARQPNDGKSLWSWRYSTEKAQFRR